MSISQFGYWKQISTIDAILKSAEQIRLELNKKKNVTGTLLDLSKAFDSIDHKILLRRLENIGFDKHATNFIERYSSESMQRVVLDGIESNWNNMKRAVQIDTILGPVIFNIYINDLANIVEKDCTVVRYADDTFLFCKVPANGEQTKNRKSCVQHEEEVNKHCSECRQWKNSWIKKCAVSWRNYW